MTVLGLLIIAITLAVASLIPGDQYAIGMVGGFVGGFIASIGIVDWLNRP